MAPIVSAAIGTNKYDWLIIIIIIIGYIILTVGLYMVILAAAVNLTIFCQFVELHYSKTWLANYIGISFFTSDF